MYAVDWRECAAEDVARLLETERDAWLDGLGWDVTTAWAVVEPSRKAGHLPGVVVFDRLGQPLGWASFVVHRDVLHVFAFVARRPDVVDRLLDSILGSADAALAVSVLVCVRAASPPLASALADRGFLVEAYRYLSSAVVDDPPTVPFAPWSGHTKAMAALCARAYEGAGGVRAFAPSGTMAEWRDYIAGLVIGPGCGTFAGDFSFVVPGPRGQLDAAVLVTSIGARAVHVAQLAVDPRARGRQLGRNLVRAARSAAARAGHQCMTLLVAASNEHAVAIYEALGFRDRSAFLVASRNQPTLSTSVALATGGDSTRL